MKTRQKPPFNFGEKFEKLKGYLLLAAAGLLVLSITRNIGKVMQIRAQVASEQAKVEKQKRENEELAKKIAETQGPFFIEKEVRDKLGLIRPGETIVVLPDADSLKALAPKSPEEDDTLPDPNWKKWGKLFF